MWDSETQKGAQTDSHEGCTHSSHRREQVPTKPKGPATQHLRIAVAGTIAAKLLPPGENTRHQLDGTDYDGSDKANGHAQEQQDAAHQEFPLPTQDLVNGKSIPRSFPAAGDTRGMIVFAKVFVAHKAFVCFVVLLDAVDADAPLFKGTVSFGNADTGAQSKVEEAAKNGRNKHDQGEDCVNDGKQNESQKLQIPLESNGSNGNSDGLVDIDGKAIERDENHANGERDKRQSSQGNARNAGTDRLEEKRDVFGHVVVESVEQVHVRSHFGSAVQSNVSPTIVPLLGVLSQEKGLGGFPNVVESPKKEGAERDTDQPEKMGNRTQKENGDS